MKRQHYRVRQAKFVVVLLVISISLLVTGYVYVEKVIAYSGEYSGKNRQSETLTGEYLLGKYHAEVYERNKLELERNREVARVKGQRTTNRRVIGGSTSPGYRDLFGNGTESGPSGSQDEATERNELNMAGKHVVVNRISPTSIPLNINANPGLENRLHPENPDPSGNDSFSVTDESNSTRMREAEWLAKTFKINEAVAMGVERPLVSYLEIVNHYWQLVVAEKEIYLYSAYYDDRESVAEPMIRIIAVAEVSPGLLFCLHWYENQDNPDVALIEVDAIGPKISPTGQTKYEQYLFSCPLVPDKGPPEKVSVITTGELTPSTLLSVQMPERPHERIEFGHCMSVAYWKHDPYRVVEWLELHRMFGVGEVTVYNNSLDNVTAYVFQNYAREGFVDFRQAPSIRNDGNELTILLNMSPVINDCLYRNMYRYRWIVCTDLDEVIVPRRQLGYRQLLRAINRRRRRHQAAKSYMFSNVYFFTDLGPVAREPWFLMTTRYLRHVKPSSYGYSVKSFTDPLACVGLQNHVCWKRVQRFRNDTEDWNIPVNSSLAMNYHYKKCHLDEFEGTFGQCKDAMRSYYKDNTMKRFERTLYDRVASKLLDLGLIEEEKEAEHDHTTV